MENVCDRFNLIPCYAPKGEGRLGDNNFDDYQTEQIVKILDTYIRQFGRPIPVGLKIEPEISLDGDCDNYIVWNVIYGYRDGILTAFVWLTEDEDEE